jgi:hypothetical protein
VSIYTPRTMPAHLRDFAAAVLAALERGVTLALVATNRAAQDNLSGGAAAAPWSYPVPNRSSNLLTSQQQAKDTPTSGYVFNTAAYAAAIHNGYVSQWAGRGKHSMRMKAAPRPFQDDAVATAQPLMVIQNTFEQALPAWA